jgi:hypothetical protein
MKYLIGNDPFDYTKIIPNVILDNEVETSLQETSDYYKKRAEEYSQFDGGINIGTIFNVKKEIIKTELPKPNSNIEFDIDTSYSIPKTNGITFSTPSTLVFETINNKSGLKFPTNAITANTNPIPSYPFTVRAIINPSNLDGHCEIVNCNIAGQRVFLSVGSTFRPNSIVLGFGGTSGWSVDYTFALNNWYDIIYVIRGSNNFDIFINGVLQTKTDHGGTMGGSASFAFGCNADGTENFKGLISKLEIYNKELTTNDVSYLYSTETKYEYTESLPSEILQTTDANINTINLLDILGDSSCVACLPLDGNANDLSGIYNGVPHTNVTYVSGKFEQGVHTNKGNIILSNLHMYNFSEFTYSCHVKFNDFGTEASYLLSQNDENWNLFYKTGKDIVCRCGGYITASNVIQNVEEFYHIVLTKKASIFKIYVNGVEKVSGSPGGYGGQGVIIGWDGYARSGQLNGIIDQVRFFNKALSVDEIIKIKTEQKLAPLNKYLPLEGQSISKSLYPELFEKVKLLTDTFQTTLPAKTNHYVKAKN